MPTSFPPPSLRASKHTFWNILGFMVAFLPVLAFCEEGLIGIDVDESKSAEGDSILSIHIERTSDLEILAMNSEYDWSVEVEITPNYFPVTSQYKLFTLNEILTRPFFVTSIRSSKIASTYKIPCIMMSIYVRVIFKDMVMYVTVYHIGFLNNGKNLAPVDSSWLYECVRMISFGYEGEYIDYRDDPYQNGN